VQLHQAASVASIHQEAHRAGVSPVTTLLVTPSANLATPATLQLLILHSAHTFSLVNE
jgi:hypothetical protein